MSRARQVALALLDRIVDALPDPHNELPWNRKQRQAEARLMERKDLVIGDARAQIATLEEINRSLSNQATVAYQEAEQARAEVAAMRRAAGVDVLALIRTIADFADQRSVQIEVAKRDGRKPPAPPVAASIYIGVLGIATGAGPDVPSAIVALMEAIVAKCPGERSDFDAKLAQLRAAIPAPAEAS